jgi:DNA-binding LacI/PurR family transcriptional regulator
MVVALRQEDLDPEKFLLANPLVMQGTIRYIKEQFGSIEAYLDTIGFDKAWRERLADCLSAPLSAAPVPSTLLY